METTGKELPVDRDYLYRWERGNRGISAFYAKRLEAVLGLPRAELGLVDGRAERWRRSKAMEPSASPSANPAFTLEADETDTRGIDLERRTFLNWLVGSAGTTLFTGLPSSAVASSARPSLGMADEAERLDAVTHQFQRMFQVIPSRDLSRPVLGHLQLITQRLQEARSPEVRRSLQTSFGQVAQLTGRLSFDRNDYPTARAYHKIAAHAAGEAEDYALVAYVLGCLSSISTDSGRPQEALALLRGTECRDAAARSGATTRSWLTALEAEAQAATGEVDGSLRSLELAQAFMDRSNSSEDPEWMRFFTQARLTGLQGFCYMRLQMPQAPDILQEAARSLQPDETRRRSIAWIDLAKAYANRNEPEEACKWAGRSLDSAAPTASPNLQERFREVRARLEPWKDLSAVKDLDEQLVAMQTPSIP